MATNPFEKFRTKIAEGLFALNTKLFADGEKVSGDNPLSMKQYGSIGSEQFMTRAGAGPVSDPAGPLEEGEVEVLLEKENIIIDEIMWGFEGENAYDYQGGGRLIFEIDGNDYNALRTVTDDLTHTRLTPEVIEKDVAPHININKFDKEEHKYFFSFNRVPFKIVGNCKIAIENNSDSHLDYIIKIIGREMQ